VCKRCTFEQPILASHVVFRRGIDLTGSTLKGRLDLEGARFEEAALFGRARFGSAADFAFSTFDDLAVFRYATFDSRADFTSASFRSARFGHAAFAKLALFEEAVFADDTSFFLAGFKTEARFERAGFGGVSDFRQANFGGTADFGGAVFRQRAEFSEANMFAQAKFGDARFEADALFGGASFLRDLDPVLFFNNAAIGGRLELDGATLVGSAELRSSAVRSLSLDGIIYGDSSSLYIDGLAADEIALDLRDVPHIEGQPNEQQRILHRAETTARSAEDLGLANDLHYRLQELASEDDGWARRLLDIGLYRYVAGYFVRPFRPLLWLLGLVFVAAVLRALTFERPTQEETARGRPVLPARALAFERLTRGDAIPGPLVRAGRRFFNALTYTVTPRGDDEDQTPALRRLELSAYALLVACFALGLANTNPTLRDMVQAVF
jgi:hypothetical protein